VVMNRCSSLEMSGSLEVVEALKKASIEFVVIPVKNPEHRKELLAQGHSAFEELFNGKN